MTTKVRKNVPAREGYDRWAPSYDASPNPVVALDEVMLGELIGDVTGRVVVDAGCGTGRHTVRLARAAAGVIALDFSAEMLARVRAKLAAEGRQGQDVQLIEHDLRRPLPLDDACADGVVCALVGEHLADLAPVLREFARVTRPGGWLVFSVYHPFLAFLGKEANFVDADTGIEYRLGAVKHLIADYVNAALQAGYTLDVLREYVANDELRDRIPDFERYRGQPLLFVMRGTRP